LDFHLLFEIGLESNLKELIAVGIPATVVPCVGVAVPFALGTAGLMNSGLLPRQVQASSERLLRPRERKSRRLWIKAYSINL